MPKKYPVEVKGWAVRMVREHESDYGSVTAACVAVDGQLGIARERVYGMEWASGGRRWLRQRRLAPPRPPTALDRRS